MSVVIFLATVMAAGLAVTTLARWYVTLRHGHPPTSAEFLEAYTRGTGWEPDE